MGLPILPLRDPDWRLAPVANRQLLFAITRALAGRRPGRPDEAPRCAVLARARRRGRSLEILCVGDVALDIVGTLAPIAGRFAAELVVRYVPDADDPAVRAAMRRGGVVVCGSLDPAAAPGLVQAPV